MKSLKNLVVVMSFAFSLNAMASLKIESVILNDGTSLTTCELVHAQMMNDGSVDYVELIDGSRIEGTEVKSVHFSNKFSKFQNTAASVRTGGDGSGG